MGRRITWNRGLPFVVRFQIANSCVQPSVRGKSAGSFPEQRLVIEPTGDLGTTFLHIKTINGALGTILLSMTFISSQQREFLLRWFGMKSAKILQPIFFEDWCNKVSLPSVVHRFSPPAVVLLSSEPSLGSVKVKLCKLMEKLRKDYESERAKRTLHFFSSLGSPLMPRGFGFVTLYSHVLSIYCDSKAK